MEIKASNITLISTKDLPEATTAPNGALTNVYDPNDGKDKKIDLSKLGGGPFDAVKFNPQTQTEQLYELAKFFYDSEENTFTVYNDIEGISLQIGEELRARLINDTGSTLLDGKAVSIIGSVGTSLKVELADASDQDSSIRGYGLMTITTINGNPGYAITYGAVRGLNTAGFTEGDIIYVDPSTPGELTNVRPKAPFYPVRIGICLFSDASNGVIAVSTLAFNGSDTSVNIEGVLNGIVLDTPDVQFSVSGGVIYADLTNEQNPTRNLPVIFSDNRYDLNTLTNTGSGGAARVVIPPGTSTTLQTSLMYVYLDNGVPTFGVSTSEPNFPYARVGTIAVYDAARTLSEGKVFAYRRTNNTTDRLDGVHDGSYGLLEEILFWARTLGSSWLSGLDATPTVNNTTIRVALTAGTGRQFRRANLPLFDGLSYRIYNDVNNVSGNYPIVDNLTTITTTAGGTTNDLLSNNRYYTIKLYYQLNSNGIGNNIIATRPTGFYTTSDEAIADASNYATVFNDPLIEEVVFPIYDLVIGRTGTGGTTISLVQLTDRRSKLPFGSGGGGASGGGGVDEKVRVSATDTTTDYLGNKVTASDGLVKETVNPGGNEQINITGKNLPFIFSQFDGLSAASTPGAGTWRLNNVVTPGSATALYINVSEYASAQDITALLSALKKDSVVRLSNRNNNLQFLNATLSADATIAAGVATLPITINDFATISNEAICGFTFLQSGIDKLDLAFALSDETSDLTTDNDGEIEVIRAQTIESITFAVNTAPTGSSILVDVLKNGTTILTGAITLTASSTTVTVTSPQISTTSLAVGDRVKADITQIGATVAGAGAKIYIKTKLA